MADADERVLEIRARYEELVNHAARLGIDLLGVLDPAGIDCSTGTRCCAGDGKVLDTREVVDPAELFQDVKGRRVQG